MVDRNVKEPLDLRLVQVHRQHAIGARCAQQVGHQLCRDRHAWLVLAVLPCVAVIRNHRGDPPCRRAPERVDHHAQFDQRLIDRRAGRLHDEDVRAPDVLVDLERDLGVRKPEQPRLPHRHAKELGDLAGERRMGAARKELQMTAVHRLVGKLRIRPARSRDSVGPNHIAPASMVGAGGFEPPNTGSKVPRLTAWPRPSPIRGASPLGLPYTLSRSPLRRLAPFAWLARFARSIADSGDPGSPTSLRGLKEWPQEE